MIVYHRELKQSVDKSIPKTLSIDFLTYIIIMHKELWGKKQSQMFFGSVSRLCGIKVCDGYKT